MYQPLPWQVGDIGGNPFRRRIQSRKLSLHLNQHRRKRVVAVTFSVIDSCQGWRISRIRDRRSRSHISRRYGRRYHLGSWTGSKTAGPTFGAVVLRRMSWCCRVHRSGIVTYVTGRYKFDGQAAETAYPTSGAMAALVTPK